jgi:hypothetical protein
MPLPPAESHPVRKRGNRESTVNHHHGLPDEPLHHEIVLPGLERALDKVGIPSTGYSPENLDKLGIIEELNFTPPH